MQKGVGAIVLAAGKGTRINSKSNNKVLFQIANKPMLCYSIELLEKSRINPIILVVGFKKEKVIECLGDGYIFVNQGKILGTGHAVKKALPAVPDNIEDVIVLYGDHSAFHKPTIIKRLIKHHKKTKAQLTFVSVDRSNPTDYGRVLRDKKGKVIVIREEKDASKKEKQIKEINTGTYCFQVKFLKKYINQIKKNPIKGEYYLTDLVEIAVNNKLIVETTKVKDEIISLGINTQEELEEVDRRMKQRLNLC